MKTTEKIPIKSEENGVESPTGDKIFAYYRVSSKEQAENENEKVQMAVVHRWLDGEVPIVEEFCDSGKSGDDPGRDGYNNMVGRLKEVDGVVVYDVDRLNRDLDVGIPLILQLRSMNKHLYVARERKIYDYNNFSDLFFHINMMMMADEEKKKITQRREDGMKRYIDEHNGEWAHRPPKQVRWDKYEEYRKAGVSIAAIARMWNLHPSTLYRRVRARKKK